MMHVREGARIVVEEQEGRAGPPDALAGELELRLPMLGGTSTLATTATVDGELGFKGRFTLSIPLPGTTKLDVPAMLHGTAGLRTEDPGCVRLDVQGTIDAPLALRMPLPESLGELDLDAALSGDATLHMALPNGHGQLQAHLRAAGPWALRLDLPDGRGRIGARGTLSTPLTLSMLLPDGRVKLGVHDTVAVETTLHAWLPHGGSIDTSGPIDTRLDGVLFLPSGRGELQATAPIRTLIHLNQVVIPQLHTPLTADIRIDGAAELTTDLPGRGIQARASFTAALPLSPLVRLLRSEIERQVNVEHIEMLTPHLEGTHEVALPLYIVVRRAVQAELLATAHLRIDPRSKQLVLRSVHAEGLNVAGRAAAWLYINPRLLRSLRHIRLFDPTGALPPEARIEALGFKAANRDELSVEGVLAWRVPHSMSRNG